MAESTDVKSSRQLAGLIDHLRMGSFPKELADFLSSFCLFDTCLMLVFKQGSAPVLVYNESAENSPALNTYLKRSYLLDPVYNVLQQGAAEGIFRLSEIAPDSFTRSEYFYNCYQAFDLVDEINLVTEVEDDCYFALALGRQSSLGSITRAELNKLHSYFPLLCSLIRQFWISNADDFLPQDGRRSTLTQALRTFGRGVLTRREQEITALILQGHSSQSIATRLGISVGTVKVHRKNIHARLNTSQQSEIFTLFLNHLNDMEMRMVA